MGKKSERRDRRLSEAIIRDENANSIIKFQLKNLDGIGWTKIGIYDRNKFSSQSEFEQFILTEWMLFRKEFFWEDDDLGDLDCVKLRQDRRLLMINWAVESGFLEAKTLKDLGKLNIPQTKEN